MERELELSREQEEMVNSLRAELGTTTVDLLLEIGYNKGLSKGMETGLDMGATIAKESFKEVKDESH